MASIKKRIKDKFPLLVDFSHKLRAMVAYFFYGAPSRRLKVIGVTGTNGKTTTCHLIARILEESGAKVGMATTTTFRVAGKEWINSTNMTSISPFALQRLLARMVRAGCDYAIVEITSHAISQYRVWGVRYLAVAMTNVTHDHLDYHKSFEEYLETKLKLFERFPRVAVANADDPNCPRFLSFSAGRQLSYSASKRADVMAKKVLPSRAGIMFTLVFPSAQVTVDLRLPGLFNVSNALCAAAVCFGLEVSPGVIKRGIEALDSVPGRMEKVEAGQDFSVIVDYAHTPDALEKAYSALTSAGRGRLIAVLGACGDRDRTKRPLMGAIAGRFGDVVVVTDEEPYTEDPKEIIEQVAEGVPRGKKSKKMVLGRDYFKVSDRRGGIAKALSLAKRGDIVVITGMGAQEYKVIGSRHLPWSDRKVAKEELKKLGYAK